MARFLVTGAGGFIGSHMVSRLLADGHTVTGVDRRPVDELGENVSPWVVGDLLAMELAPLLDGVTHVIHLAGQPGVRESWGQFPAYTRGNIETTQRLLEALRGRENVRFVLASTSSVYGMAPMPAREDGPVLPISPYGATKLAAESLCDLYGRIAGLSWVALRYFTVYGPRQRPDMAFTRWLRATHSGDPIQIYGSGEQIRDFTYVDDAVAVTIRAALNPDLSGMAVNVGGGSRVSIREALAVISQVTGRTAKVTHLPPAQGDMLVTQAETTRLERVLSFKPATQLSAGIARQYEWIVREKGV